MGAEKAGAWVGSLPGTTSRASMASLYSMKPKPFMSLISVMSPVPWDAKWASTSALVARDEVRGLDRGPRARRGSTQVEAQRARRL